MNTTKLAMVTSPFSLKEESIKGKGRKIEVAEPGATETSFSTSQVDITRFLDNLTGYKLN